MVTEAKMVEGKGAGPMNVVLWILQVTLAFFALSGGAYKVFSFDAVVNEPWFGALPRAGWGALGVLELLCAILLIVPAATKRMPTLTPIAAAVLAVESLGLAALYASHSVALTASNPLVFVAPIGLLAAFVAYGRHALRPLS